MLPAVRITLSMALLLLGLLAQPLAAQAPASKIQKKTYDFKEAGKEMEYALFVPTSYDKAKKSPLIVALHGLGSNPQQIMRYPGMTTLAEKHGYIVVAPMGYNTRGWYGSPPPGRRKTEPENLAHTSKDGDPLFKQGERVYTLMDLTAALGLDSASSDKRVPILLVRMGAREVAVRVDELLGTDEIVVKPLGGHLGRLSGISGATVTGDGSVVLILDLAELWLAQERLPAFRHEVAQESDAPPRVMVVDDSLTVRKVTGRNLGRHGMEVSMARDGIDALEQLAKAKPDLILVDIEMPRMDGYELTTRIREDVHYRDIPIIMITSRSGAKHREKAMELGANAYLTKPYQERDLLREINALMARTEQATPD